MTVRVTGSGQVETMIKISFVFFLIVFCLGMQSSSCIPDKKADNANEEVFTIGPAEPTNLVVFFKKGTSHEQIESFYNEVISVWRPDLKGYDLADGVVSRYMTRNGDYQGVGINFRTDATAGQREKLKNAIQASPIVYKIYENVVPDEIKDLNGSQMKSPRAHKTDDGKPE